MKALRKGSTGSDVFRWQQFLRGQELYWGKCDGKFGELTQTATRAFQIRCTLSPVDGIVGNDTYREAMAIGLSIVESESAARLGPNWPPKPSNLRKMEAHERSIKLGTLLFKADPIAGNPERIKLTNSWSDDNIVQTEIPQLGKIRGVLHKGKMVGVGPRGGVVWCHKLFAGPLRATFADWEEANLLKGILTYDGLWVPRFIRGSRAYLSNHSYGTAIDLNAAWNGFRCRPALVGHKGCLREHVEIANNNGIWWLGHTMDDGMHLSLGVKT